MKAEVKADNRKRRLFFFVTAEVDAWDDDTYHTLKRLLETKLISKTVVDIRGRGVAEVVQVKALQPLEGDSANSSDVPDVTISQEVTK